MLETLRDAANQRKFRLFASACCRRLTPHFKDECSLRMVEISDLFADDQVSLDELNAAFDEAAVAQEAIHLEGGDAVDQASAEAVLGLREGLEIGQVFEGVDEVAGALASAAVWELIHRPGRHWRETEAECQEVEEAGASKEFAVLAILLRDIFGNPFQPVAPNPAWRTDTVLALARQMYESRDFSAMPILADALQDAGCDNEDVLNHCRDTNQPHVRGCWVVDLVLGKE
ncbi:MAG: hypothetical protein L0241_27940 [Planctomycetia bacterium]|nr:hypothetical protein [Planctomycetia bacterium]